MKRRSDSQQGFFLVSALLMLVMVSLLLAAGARTLRSAERYRQRRELEAQRQGALECAWVVGEARWRKLLADDSAPHLIDPAGWIVVAEQWQDLLPVRSMAAASGATSLADSALGQSSPEAIPQDAVLLDAVPRDALPRDALPRDEATRNLPPWRLECRVRATKVGSSTAVVARAPASRRLQRVVVPSLYVRTSSEESLSVALSLHFEEHSWKRDAAALLSRGVRAFAEQHPPSSLLADHFEPALRSWLENAYAQGVWPASLQMAATEFRATLEDFFLAVHPRARLRRTQSHRARLPGRDRGRLDPSSRCVLYFDWPTRFELVARVLTAQGELVTEGSRVIEPLERLHLATQEALSYSSWQQSGVTNMDCVCGPEPLAAQRWLLGEAQSWPRDDAMRSASVARVPGGLLLSAASALRASPQLWIGPHAPVATSLSPRWKGEGLTYTTDNSWWWNAASELSATGPQHQQRCRRSFSAGIVKTLPLSAVSAPSAALVTPRGERGAESEELARAVLAVCLDDGRVQGLGSDGSVRWSRAFVAPQQWLSLPHLGLIAIGERGAGWWLTESMGRWRGVDAAVPLTDVIEDGACGFVTLDSAGALFHSTFRRTALEVRVLAAEELAISAEARLIEFTGASLCAVVAGSQLKLIALDRSQRAPPRICGSGTLPLAEHWWGVSFPPALYGVAADRLWYVPLLDASGAQRDLDLQCTLAPAAVAVGADLELPLAGTLHGRWRDRHFTAGGSVNATGSALGGDDLLDLTAAGLYLSPQRGEHLTLSSVAPTELSSDQGAAFLWVKPERSASECTDPQRTRVLLQLRQSIEVELQPDLRELLHAHPAAFAQERLHSYVVVGAPRRVGEWRHQLERHPASARWGYRRTLSWFGEPWKLRVTLKNPTEVLDDWVLPFAYEDGEAWVTVPDESVAGEWVGFSWGWNAPYALELEVRQGESSRVAQGSVSFRAGFSATTLRQHTQVWGLQLGGEFATPAPASGGATGVSSKAFRGTVRGLALWSEQGRHPVPSPFRDVSGEPIRGELRWHFGCSAPDSMLLELGAWGDLSSATQLRWQLGSWRAPQLGRSQFALRHGAGLRPAIARHSARSWEVLLTLSPDESASRSALLEGLTATLLTPPLRLLGRVPGE